MCDLCVETGPRTKGHRPANGRGFAACPRRYPSESGKKDKSSSNILGQGGCAGAISTEDPTLERTRERPNEEQAWGPQKSCSRPYRERLSVF